MNMPIMMCSDSSMGTHEASLTMKGL